MFSRILDFSPTQWRNNSYLYTPVGLLARWRSSSWLLQWGDSLGLIFLALVLALGPFVSTGLIGILLIASAAYWFLLTLSEEGMGLVSPIHILVLLYWSIATVATAFSPVKAAAFSGWTKLSLYLLFFALAARVLRSPRLTHWLLSIFLLVALIVSVYGIRQQLFGAEQLATWNDPTSELAGDTRVYSYLGNPNLLASYLLPAIALSLAAIFVWQGYLPKILALVMALVHTSCLYFTDSRGGWIGLLVLLLTFLALLYYWFSDRLSPFWRKWLLPLVLGALGTFLLLAFWQVDSLRLRVMSIFVGRNDSSNNFRLNVWTAVVKMIKAYPWLGIGPGNVAFNKVYPLFMQPKYTALSAYSVFLEILVETGIIGFTVFFWLLATTFRQGTQILASLRQQANHQGFWLIAALATMAGMLGHGLVDTVWYRPQINTLWWLMIALIASRYPTKVNNS